MLVRRAAAGGVGRCQMKAGREGEKAKRPIRNVRRRGARRQKVITRRGQGEVRRGRRGRAKETREERD